MRTRYSPSDKQRLVREALYAGNYSEVARRYDVKRTTLHTWIKKFREPVMVDAENQKLKQENQQLVEQNELLSKELSEIREVLVDTVIELSTLKRTLNSRTK